MHTFTFKLKATTLNHSAIKVIHCNIPSCVVVLSLSKYTQNDMSLLPFHNIVWFVVYYLWSICQKHSMSKTQLLKVAVNQLIIKNNISLPTFHRVHISYGTYTVATECRGIVPFGSYVKCIYLRSCIYTINWSDMVLVIAAEQHSI